MSPGLAYLSPHMSECLVIPKIKHVKKKRGGETKKVKHVSVSCHRTLHTLGMERASVHSSYAPWETPLLFPLTMMPRKGIKIGNEENHPQQLHEI